MLKIAWLSFELNLFGSYKKNKNWIPVWKKVCKIRRKKLLKKEKKIEKNKVWKKNHKKFVELLIFSEFHNLFNFILENFIILTFEF